MNTKIKLTTAQVKDFAIVTQTLFDAKAEELNYVNFYLNFQILQRLERKIFNASFANNRKNITLTFTPSESLAILELIKTAEQKYVTTYEHLLVQFTTTIYKQLLDLEHQKNMYCARVKVLNTNFDLRQIN